MLSFARIISFLLVFLLSLFLGGYLRYVHDSFAIISFDYQNLLAKLLRGDNHKIPSVQISSVEKDSDYELVFVGDVMLSRGVAHQIKKNNDFNYPFLKAADFLRKADLTFGNLEGPISSRGKNKGSIYSFRADPRVIEGLEFAGFDVLSVANNHIFDWSREALEDTITLLKQNSIAPVGAGFSYQEANNPVLVRLNDLTLAFFAFTNLYPKSLEATASHSGISSFEPEIIKKAIFASRSRADLIIVSLHWGEEYESEPSSFQKKLAREFIDAGANLIIGHHPHVVQKYEPYKQSWIFYSLGNFVFDQNFRDDTMRGLMVKVAVKGKKIAVVEPIKININVTFQPEMSGL